MRDLLKGFFYLPHLVCVRQVAVDRHLESPSDRLKSLPDRLRVNYSELKRDLHGPEAVNGRLKPMHGYQMRNYSRPKRSHTHQEETHDHPMRVNVHQERDYTHPELMCGHPMRTFTHLESIYGHPKRDFTHQEPGIGSATEFFNF